MRAFVRALAWARVCPRGLAVVGARRPVGPAVGGACPRKGRLFEGLDSWKLWVRPSIIS